VHVDSDLLDRAASNTIAGFGWIAAAEDHLGARRLRQDDPPADVANSAASSAPTRQSRWHGPSWRKPKR